MRARQTIHTVARLCRVNGWEFCDRFLERCGRYLSARPVTAIYSRSSETFFHEHAAARGVRANTPGATRKFGTEAQSRLHSRPRKPVPVMVREAPTAPETRDRLVMAGVGTAVKLIPLLATRLARLA